MKVVEKNKATAALADYAEQAAEGPVVVTVKGKPVAVLLLLENTDLESIAVSTNPKFIELIEHSRAMARKHGWISSEEIRRQFGIPARRGNRNSRRVGQSHRNKSGNKA